MVHSRMFILKEERRQSEELFYSAIVDLETLILRDSPYEEIEEAIEEVCRCLRGSP